MEIIIDKQIEHIYYIGNDKYLLCINENDQMIYDKITNKIIMKFYNIIKLNNGYHDKNTLNSFGSNSLVKINNNYYNTTYNISENSIDFNIIKIDGKTFEYVKYFSEKYLSHSIIYPPCFLSFKTIKNTLIISYYIYNPSNVITSKIILLGTKIKNIKHHNGTLTETTSDETKIVIQEKDTNKYLIYDSIETKLLHSVDNIIFIDNNIIYDNNKIIQFNNPYNINIKFDNKNIYLTTIRNIFYTYECVISDCPSSKLFNTIDQLYDGISDALNNLNNLSYKIYEYENEIMLIINYDNKYLKVEHKFVLTKVQLDKINILELKVNYLYNNLNK